MSVSAASRAPNFAAVEAMIADRRPIPIVSRKASPEPMLPRDGVAAGQWKPGPLGLPVECPVVPLGVSGSVGYFLDPIGQLQVLAPPYGKGHLLGLFCGDENYLSWAWPRFCKKREDGTCIDGFAAEKAAAALIAACAAKGPWQAVDRIRGRGAWTGRDGNVVLHRGTAVLMRGRAQPPGEFDGYVYPARVEISGPWPGVADDAANPARLLLPLFSSWQWARPEVDPTLLLGWIGAAFIGGALPWRPVAYITGDKATGKSTLQGIVKDLLGDYLIQAVDTTGAGIYQHVGLDSLAVAVDEIEGEADVRKAKTVLKLARIAASGGLMLRGGDRHNPVEFRARSCFVFSSINTPPLEPQDLSRMALLRLSRLPAGQALPPLPPDVMPVIGRCILRRMIEQWPRFDETFRAFRGVLADAGMDGRGQDTFGVLLTCADMVEHDGWDEERLRKVSDTGDLVAWADLMHVDRMMEFEDAAENWRLCLSHLLGVRVDAWRNGMRPTVGQLIYDLWQERDASLGVDAARKQLFGAGLGLVTRSGSRKDWWLAVPNQSPLTRTLFDGSKWAGDVGAGVWAGALRQSPRGAIHDVATARVGGDVMRCTLISLQGLYGDGGIIADDEKGGRG